MISHESIRFYRTCRCHIPCAVKKLLCKVSRCSRDQTLMTSQDIATDDLSRHKGDIVKLFLSTASPMNLTVLTMRSSNGVNAFAFCFLVRYYGHRPYYRSVFHRFITTSLC